MECCRSFFLVFIFNEKCSVHYKMFPLEGPAACFIWYMCRPSMRTDSKVTINNRDNLLRPEVRINNRYRLLKPEVRTNNRDSFLRPEVRINNRDSFLRPEVRINNRDSFLRPEVRINNRDSFLRPEVRINNRDSFLKQEVRINNRDSFLKQEVSINNWRKWTTEQVSFWHMIVLCRNCRDCFLSIRASFEVQQPVRSEWHIQDGSQCCQKLCHFCLP